ncbi:MAG: helix-turn-helix domain-containing protein [Bacteroidales bacterium]|nr:helix-turn-helix domain-containing protein [Bacteroidales bacterium]
MNQNVGQYLSNFLAERKISEAKFAEELHISRPMVTYILKGERSLSLKQALRIERYCDLEEGTLLHMQVEQHLSQYKKDLRGKIYNRLIDQKAFWSYPLGVPDHITDEELIEKTFVCLDLDDIKLLFDLFPKTFIKKVWVENMLPQGDYLRRLNTMVAFLYFRIDNPESYIARQEKLQQKRRLNYV